MQKKIEIQSKIEEIFSNSKIKYTYLNDVEDNDLNYDVWISVGGILSPLKFIQALCYISFEDNTLNFMVPNIYKITQEDNITQLYKIINKANIELSTGVFGVVEISSTKSKQIIYKSTYNCEENFCNLTTTSFEEQINNIISNIIYIFGELKRMKIDGV